MNRCARCGRPASGRLCAACQPGGPAAPGSFAPTSAGPAPRLTGPPTAPKPTSPKPFTLGRPPALPRPTGSPVPVGPPAAGPNWLLTSEPGTVANTPVATAGRPSIEDQLGRIAIGLAIAVVLTNPAMLGVLFWWLLLSLGLMWLLGRLGLTSSLGLLLAMGRGRGSAPRWHPPVLTFRCQFGSEAREVQIRGFDTGVQLGDQLEVTGPTASGVVHATRVVNLSNGAVLRRHALVRTVVLSVLCAWLLLTLVAQLVAR